MKIIYAHMLITTDTYMHIHLTVNMYNNEYYGKWWQNEKYNKTAEW